MNPLDYSGAFGPVDPSQALMQGLQTGAAIGELQDKRAAQQAAVEKARLAAIRTQEMQNEMEELSNNPTAAGITQFSIKYPEISEQMKRSYDMQDPLEKQAHLDKFTKIASAYESGYPEIGIKLMRDDAQALRNSGNEREAGAAEALATIFEKDPKAGKLYSGKMLASIAGPEKYAEAMSKIGGEQRAQDLAPDVLRKTKADAGAAESEAKVKEVDAKYADSKAIQEIEKRGWDIKKIKADIDIARESNRIAAMNAAANREGNSLKRQELQLKIDDAKMARDDKINEKVAKAESGISAMDNMLNTVARLKKNPSLKDVVGSIEGRLPSVLSDEGADAIALFDTLGSQAFLSQVPTVQGMGSLSNAEGEKLQSALQNLSRAQSEKQVNANLVEVERLVNKARANVSNRYGVPLRAPDTPAAAPAGDDAAAVRARADAILGGGNGNR